jgi:tetratricopeptide (TPR) repeat protein
MATSRSCPASAADVQPVTRLLDRESKIRPVLLIFEDLHWVDAETEAFLDALADGRSTARRLLLATYRPEYVLNCEGKPNYTRLLLDSLRPESADALLDALLGRDVALDPLKQLLTSTTGRNPFFIEESVRTLVETRTLAGERGAYRLARSVDAIEAPATVQAVLAARIDRLPGEDKRLLEVASVIGNDVPYELLATIAAMSDAELRQRIARLQAAEFFYETRPSPDLEYTFKHALTHEVAYGGLLHARRRDLHARIVRAIETMYQPRLLEHVERLAHHAVRGELSEEAVRYQRQAGHKALERSGNREAAGWFEQALTVLAHLPESDETLAEGIDLRFELRASLLPLGEFDSILRYLREAEGVARKLDDQRRLGEVFCDICHTLYITGHPTDALPFGQSAEAIAESLADLPLRVGANLHFGYACVGAGEYQRAGACLTKVLLLLDDDPYRAPRLVHAGLPAVMARGALTWTSAEQGRFEEGIAHGREGLRVAEAADQPYSLADAFWRLAHLRIVRGEFDDALHLLERGLALSRKWSLTLYSVIFSGTLGYVYARSGRMAEGVPLLEHALSATERMGYGALQPRFLIYLGEAHGLTDRLDRSLEFGGRALSFARVRGQRPYEAQALLLMGDVAGRRDLGEHAQGHYRDALVLAEEREMRPLVAHCHFGLGRLWRRNGERLAAVEYFTTAGTMYREMGMTSWLERSEGELSEMR